MKNIETPKIKDLFVINEMISSALDYPVGKSFRDDFPRLLHEDNLHNLRIIRDDKQKIISHVGSIPFTWIDKEKDIQLSCVIFGGVCTDHSYRGQGLASHLLKALSEHWANTADLALLWTDKNELYEKQGFSPAGCQFLIDCEDLEKKGVLNLNEESSFKAEFSTLDQLPIEHLEGIYNKQSSLITRTPEDWKKIQETSHSVAVMAFDSQNESLAYLVFEKGHDFPQVIHEIVGEWDACLFLIKQLREKYKNVHFLLYPPKNDFSEEMHSRGVQIFPMDLALMKILNRESFEKQFKISDQKSSQQLLEEVFGSKENPTARIPFWVWGLDSH